MKIHRVTCLLPKGSVVRTRTSNLPWLPGGGLDDIVNRTVTYKANAPIELTLEVTEEGAADTAKELRRMADELEGRR